MDLLQQLRQGSTLHLKLLFGVLWADSWTMGAEPAIFTRDVTAPFGWDLGLITHRNPIVFISWHLSLSFPRLSVLRPFLHSLSSHIALSPQGLGEEWPLLVAYQHGLFSLRKQFTPELSLQNNSSFFGLTWTKPRWPEEMVSVFPASTGAWGRFSLIRNLRVRRTTQWKKNKHSPFAPSPSVKKQACTPEAWDVLSPFS